MSLNRMDSLDALRSGVDTLFKALEETGITPESIVTPTIRRGVSSTFCMPLDILEKEDMYQIVVDVPGSSKEMVSLKIDDAKSTITITAERKRMQTDEKEAGPKLLLRERGGGRIQRIVTLPQEGDLDKAEAELKDGVLYLTVPKSETRGMRKMQIK